MQLVIADAHLGLRQAVQATKGSAEMVAAAIRTSFAQPDATPVHDQLDVIAGMLGWRFPKLEAMAV